MVNIDLYNDGGDDMFTCHKCGSDDNQPISEGDGLWANIHAKRKRGEKPSHGNSYVITASWTWNIA